MVSLFTMAVTTFIGLLLAPFTVGLSLLIPLWAWFWCRRRERRQEAEKLNELYGLMPVGQLPQPQPAPQRTWFFGFFWW